MRVTRSQLRARILGGHHVRIVKADQPEARYVLGVAYPGGSPDDTDGHGEFMRPEELERTAWAYLAERQIGLWHEDGTTGHLRPVESYIYRGPDWTLTDISGNTQVIKAGDWLLGAIADPQSWSLIKSGRANGWSIDGAGKRRTIKRETV